MNTEQLGYTAALVLQAMSKGHRYGFEIMKVTGLASGTVYPLLRRLEANALVQSTWEDVDPSSEGRPPRRIYQVTIRGSQALETAVARLAAHQRLFEGATAHDPRAGA